MMVTAVKTKTFLPPKQDESRFNKPLVYPELGLFFCDACLERQPIDDQSRQDGRYCQAMYDLMAANATPENEQPDYWLPSGVFVHNGEKYTATPSGRTKNLGKVINPAGATPANQPDAPTKPCTAILAVTEAPTVPNIVVTLDVTALVSKLDKQGLSLRDISAKLAGRGILASHMKVKRILDGQAVML